MEFLRKHTGMVLALAAFSVFSLGLLFSTRSVLQAIQASSQPAQPKKYQTPPASRKKCPKGTELSRVAPGLSDSSSLSQDAPTTTVTPSVQWVCLPKSARKGVRAPSFKEINCGCDDTYQPVCGSDYQIYPNECVAKCRNKTVSYRGECKVAPTGTPASGCRVCTQVCNEGEVFYQDGKGCPVCSCRSAPFVE